LVRCGQGKVLPVHCLFSEILSVCLYLNWNKNSDDGDVGGGDYYYYYYYDHVMYISKNNTKNDTFYSEALQQYISSLRGHRIAIIIHT
jgi:hypothetical protein